MAEPGSGFATRFDPPETWLALPGVVSRGSDPSLRVADGVLRHRVVVVRMTREAALLGFKVAATRPVRVELALSRVPDERRPNFVEVRAGSAVTVALIRPIRGVDPATADHVALCVPADDLPPGGLLLVELAGAAYRLPPELRDRVAPGGATGVRLLEARFDPLGAPDGGAAPEAVAASVGRLTGTPVAGGLMLLDPRVKGQVRIRGGFAVPVVPPRPPAGPSPRKLRRPPSRPPLRYASKVAEARATHPQITAAAPLEAPVAPDSGAPAQFARRVLARIARTVAARTPSVVQRILVGASCLVPMGHGRPAAVDLDSGLAVPVSLRRSGTGLLLTVDGDHQGPLLVAMPMDPRRWLIAGWQARWIEWHVEPVQEAVVGGEGLEPPTSSV